MIRKFFLLLLLAVLAVPALAGDISGTVKVGGATRSYKGYVPKDLGENQPLLISCHGMNQDAAYQKNMLAIESVADKGKFLTIFPEGEGKSWDIGGDKDINFMKALIDEMVVKYKIDRNRVYLSGFSMGGMFTYHAMNKIPDLIAAFAPISGYPMGGTSINANVRPLPVIHTHGTSDDVVAFSGVQGAMNALIAHNGCSKTAKVEKSYRGASHITRHTWSGGKDGVEVVLMEMAGKGHWISNDNGVKTGEEIWNFCKRFSFRSPIVTITSPKKVPTFLSFGGTPKVSLTFTAEAKASANVADGQIVKVAFYDGNTLLAECTEPPYTYTVELAKGTHTISVVATDNEGNTGSAEQIIEMTQLTNNTAYSMNKSFINNGGCVPDGWVTYDGSNRRIGLTASFTTGARVIQMTGEKKDFTWGLYTRNVNGKAKQGYARFADSLSTVNMTLFPGTYQLLTRVVNWNRPEFSPVTVAVETIDGQEVFAQVIQPQANIGNKASNSFEGSKAVTIKFDIAEQGRYVITYYTDDVKLADLVIGSASLKRTGNTTGIDNTPSAIHLPSSADIYDLSGRRVQGAVVRPGIYIRGGKKVMVK